MKFRNTFLLITLVVIGLLPSSISTSTSENHHVPRLYRGTMDWPPFPPPDPPEDESMPEWSPQPYMAGYMDADGIHPRVDKIRVTVSFPTRIRQ